MFHLSRLDSRAVVARLHYIRVLTTYGGEIRVKKNATTVQQVQSEMNFDSSGSRTDANTVLNNLPFK